MKRSLSLFLVLVLTACFFGNALALNYVAEFATDKCRFMPVRGNKIGKGKGG